jgi:hypothetical protein
MGSVSLTTLLLRTLFGLRAESVSLGRRAVSLLLRLVLLGRSGFSGGVMDPGGPLRVLSRGVSECYGVKQVQGLGQKA